MGGAEPEDPNVWAAVAPSAGPVGGEEGGPRGGAERLVDRFPEAPSRDAAVQAERGAGQANHGGGIARGGKVGFGQLLREGGAQEGGESARVP